MSDWEPVVILKTNVSVQDVYHGLGERGFTRCGRQLSITSLPHWRWKYADAGWVRACARCFPDSFQETSRPSE